MKYTKEQKTTIRLVGKNATEIVLGEAALRLSLEEYNRLKEIAKKAAENAFAAAFYGDREAAGQIAESPDIVLAMTTHIRSLPVGSVLFAIQIAEAVLRQQEQQEQQGGQGEGETDEESKAGGGGNNDRNNDGGDSADKGDGNNDSNGDSNNNDGGQEDGESEGNGSGNGNGNGQEDGGGNNRGGGQNDTKLPTSIVAKAAADAASKAGQVGEPGNAEIDGESKESEDGSGGNAAGKGRTDIARVKAAMPRARLASVAGIYLGRFAAEMRKMLDAGAAETGVVPVPGEYGYVGLQDASPVAIMRLATPVGRVQYAQAGGRLWSETTKLAPLGGLTVIYHDVSGSMGNPVQGDWRTAHRGTLLRSDLAVALSLEVIRNAQETQTDWIWAAFSYDHRNAWMWSKNTVTPEDGNPTAEILSFKHGAGRTDIGGVLRHIVSLAEIRPYVDAVLITDGDDYIYPKTMEMILRARKERGLRLFVLEIMGDMKAGTSGVVDPDNMAQHIAPELHDMLNKNPYPGTTIKTALSIIATAWAAIMGDKNDTARIAVLAREIVNSRGEYSPELVREAQSVSASMTAREAFERARENAFK